MGDVGDYWREHKEYKRVIQRKNDQYDAEVAAGNVSRGFAERGGLAVALAEANLEQQLAATAFGMHGDEQIADREVFGPQEGRFIVRPPLEIFHELERQS